MFLFLSIILLCFLLTIATDIVKFLKISSLFVQNKNVSSPLLKEELEKAKQELDKVVNAAGQDRYVQQIRKMRAEEKLLEAQFKINGDRRKSQMKSYSTELMLGYGFKALLYLSLVVISIRNRYNPVMIFGNEVNLQPLQGLLSFPTGVNNAISVPIWVLSCNVTFRLISGLVKQKLSK